MCYGSNSFHQSRYVSVSFDGNSHSLHAIAYMWLDHWRTSKVFIIDWSVWMVCTNAHENSIYANKSNVTRILRNDIEIWLDFPFWLVFRNLWLFGIYIATTSNKHFNAIEFHLQRDKKAHIVFHFIKAIATNKTRFTFNEVCRSFRSILTQTEMECKIKVYKKKKTATTTPPHDPIYKSARNQKE